MHLSFVEGSDEEVARTFKFEHALAVHLTFIECSTVFCVVFNVMLETLTVLDFLSTIVNFDLTLVLETCVFYLVPIWLFFHFSVFGGFGKDIRCFLQFFGLFNLLISLSLLI